MKFGKVLKTRDYICKGCASYINERGDRLHCNTVHKKNGHACPCSTCLVKSMCEQQCDDFKIYSGSDKNHPYKPHPVINEGMWKYIS